MSAPADLVCPKCKADLVASAALRCARCAVDYPLVDGIPVLVAEPRAYLAQAVLGYEERLNRWVERLKQIELALSAPQLAFRKPTLEKLKHAFEQNLALGRKQQATIVPHVDVATIAAQAVRRDRDFLDWYDLNRVLNYLQIDWGGTTEGEAHVATIESAVFAQIDRYCDRKSSATFLGAGMGRYLVDAADRFERVFGFELSLPHLVTFAQLKREPITFSHLQLQSPSSSGEAALELTARMPDAPRAHPGIHHVAADATRLPLRDHSQSTVISIFFSDVVPLPRLLKEVTRVLRPGGRFINFGPLLYHFKEGDGMLLPEEAQHVMREFGYTMEEQRWLRMPLGDNPGGSTTRSVDAWSYVLTKN